MRGQQDRHDKERFDGGKVGCYVPGASVVTLHVGTAVPTKMQVQRAGEGSLLCALGCISAVRAAVTESPRHCRQMLRVFTDMNTKQYDTAGSAHH